MKFLILLTFCFICIQLYLSLIPWLVENLIPSAGITIACLLAFLLTFGFGIPIARALGIYHTKE